MERLLQDQHISKVLTPVGGKNKNWRRVLEQFRNCETGITRQTVRDNAIKAIQRMLVFLGYSTSSTDAIALVQVLGVHAIGFQSMRQGSGYLLGGLALRCQL